MKTGLTVLLMAMAAAAQTFYSTHSKRGHCNPGLLATYDLEMIRKPTNETNFLCPAVDDNCCTTTSQLYIYRKWMGRGERDRLLQVYKTLIATYDILFDDMYLVEQMAEIVLAQIPSDQITNCGELAKGIRQLKASGMKQSVMTQVKRAYRFIFDSRRGFYCSLCDADAHFNYNSLDGAIRMSHGFCANLVKETIGWNSFRYEHFPKITRLYGHFMSSCQSNGQFDPNVSLKEEHKFFQRRRFLDQIKTCLEGLNDPHAVHTCYDYCAHFNPAKFSRLFEGQFERLLSFRVWLNKEVVAKIFSSLNGITKDDLSFKGRLLAEARHLQQSNPPQGGSGGAPASGAPGAPGAQGTPGAPGAPATPAQPAPEPFTEAMSPVNFFNRQYNAQAVTPMTYSASEDFRSVRVFNYRSSIFHLGKDKLYDLSQFRMMLHSSGINFQTYGYMLTINNDTLSSLDAQLEIESDNDFRNVTDPLSPNYQYRRSSVQIIS